MAFKTGRIICKEAKRILVDVGFYSDQDFEGVTVAWCSAMKEGAGMVPAPDRILLSRVLRHHSGKSITSLLAHEMVHIKQIRRKGFSCFACEYSQELVLGHGTTCSNILESPGYQTQAQAEHAINGWDGNLIDTQKCGLDFGPLPRSCPT